MSEIRVENIVGETGTDAVKFAAGNEVKFAPLIAGSVPVILAAGTFVKLAALPLNVVAVTTPEDTFIPLVKLTASAPVSPIIFVTLISDIF